MANIFNEVDEDIRKERYQNLWRKYGKYIAGFLVLIVIIFSLSQYLHLKKISDNRKILDTYLLAIENIEKNQFALAKQDLEIVYNEKNIVLSAISGLKLSDEYLDKNQIKEATLVLKNIYNNNSIEAIFRELALYKYIMINFENTEVAEIEAMVSSFVANKKILNLYFQEIIGIKYLTLGNFKKAESIFKDLSLDETTPFDLKMRLDKLIQIAS